LKEVGVDQNDIIRVTINAKYYRPCEVDLLLGDPTKAERVLGWKREFDDLDKLIEHMFS
jgi:GDPmannose 4,6-dehydratase